ncbi:hypothetical protein CerSpe_169660 [Prunus speciosa]
MVNSDGAWDPSSLEGGTGVVIRGGLGSVLGISSSSSFGYSAIQVKTLVLLDGLRLANSLGLREVIMESDSQSAILAAGGRIKRNAWELFLILNEIRNFGSRFSHILWNWVPRDANHAANYVVMLARRRI